MLNIWDSYHFHLNFMGVIEKNRDPKLNVYDLFLKHAGIDPDSIKDKKPIYNIDRWSTNKIENLMKFQWEIDDNDILIGIQIRSNDQKRTYPTSKLNQLILALASYTGVKIFLLGQKGDLGRKKTCQFKIAGRDNIFDLTGQLTLKEIFAFIDKLNLIITPDSAFNHVAAALDTYSIALHNAFPSITRCKYYERCIPIETNWKICNHCMFHGNESCEYLDEQSFSRCWDTLPYESVLTTALNFIAKIKPKIYTSRLK